MSAEVTHSELLPRKGRRRKAEAGPNYSSKAEIAQFNELQSGLPVGLPKGVDWVEPSGEAFNQGVTANPVPIAPTYVAEGIELPSEALLVTTVTCWVHSVVTLLGAGRVWTSWPRGTGVRRLGVDRPA